jgi:predicted RNA binding protein YcfA (HicA-like mRNA interferase family)
MNKIRKSGYCFVLRQKGSRKFVACTCEEATCRTTVPMHGRELGTGLLRQIERDLEPCSGRGWLRT